MTFERPTFLLLLLLVPVLWIWLRDWGIARHYFEMRGVRRVACAGRSVGEYGGKENGVTIVMDTSASMTKGPSSARSDRARSGSPVQYGFDLTTLRNATGLICHPGRNDVSIPVVDANYSAGLMWKARCNWR
jgi:hypothetical protein